MKKGKTLANVVSWDALMEVIWNESTETDVRAVVGDRKWFWDDEVEEIKDKVYAKTYQRLNEGLTA